VNRTQPQSGQVLILFAGGLIGLLALLALALDLSSVYALQRTERSAADAAALAGAQDLQIPGKRALDAAHVASARQDALSNLVSRFGASGTATTASPGSNCTAASADVSDCGLVGTPYWVTIKTPSPIALDVAPSRAVMVTVRQHDVPLTIARLFGQHDWNVAQTSVAGIAFSSTYAVVTLQPPTSGRTGNYGDITINSTNGDVAAINGDIGVNTTDVLNGKHATVDVADGYYVSYYGNTAAMQESNPPGPTAYKQLPALIPDPNYTVPIQPTPTGWTTDALAQDTSSKCTAAKAAALLNAYPAVDYCYQPGVYSFYFNVANKKTALLEPGVYWFNQGLLVQGNLIGGYETASEGVALIVPQTQPFTVNGGGSGSANLLALNRGSAFSTGANCGSPSICATPSLMPDNVTKVQTDPTTGLPLSVIVAPNPLNPCPVVVPAPSGCAKQTGTINWSGAGGGSTLLAVAGVVYAPSDNIQVAGSTDSRGYFGQLVAWTITYSGQSTLNQTFEGGIPNGSVRLDQACSGGTSPCAP
jgi:Putative Flp pilus-assembly TadE/G-like